MMNNSTQNVKTKLTQIGQKQDLVKRSIEKRRQNIKKSFKFKHYLLNFVKTFYVFSPQTVTKIIIVVFMQIRHIKLMGLFIPKIQKELNYNKDINNKEGQYDRIQ
jgi:uncharacterized membrane protein